MSRSPHALAALVAALAFATAAHSQDPVPLPLPPAPPKPDNKGATTDGRVTVVERGPVHEGFAQPGASVRGKDITAPKAPPAPVEEVPPVPKPEGANVRWVPGYWEWDDERTDFVWVCGLYRNVPPERRWEPGQWEEVKKRWTYFPGYWRPNDNKSLAADLPEPPASKEDAPPPNDNPNAMFVPGFWEHKDGKFEWRPGYWPAGFRTMIWQPNQYVLTATGFAFVPGHWDYPLEERGPLQSPVYFSQAQRQKRGWAYRPNHVVSFGSDSKWGQGGAFDTLSIDPNYNSYFYGNLSSKVGLLPSAGGAADNRSWDTVSRGYTNPLWQHYKRLNRTDSGLAKGTPPPLDAAQKARGGTNPLAFVTPGCGSGIGCGIGPHVHWVPTPVFHGGRR